MRWFGAVLALLASSLEDLGPATHRAVTLEPGERRRFHVPGLETITGGTGQCIDESLDAEVPETLTLEATCGGVRTTLAWRRGGARVHILACAEDASRPAALLPLRRQLQRELSALRSVAACVRNGKVELWGWVSTPAELARLAALEKQHGLERVRNHVELLDGP
jgi:hypothetical protein